MRRRKTLACTVALLTAAAGCSSTPTETTSQTTTTSTVTSATEPQTTTTTEPTVEDERPTQPELNQTRYDVAWEWNLGRSALPNEEDPTVALITGTNWEETIQEENIDAGSRQFLESTDYNKSTVVAFQASVMEGKNRFILEQVEGAETEQVTLTIREWAAKSGLQNQPIHLMLLRLPNGDSPPQTVTVTGDFEASTTRS